MAENQTFKIPAHHNIYNGKTGRELRIDFSVPDNINVETGLLPLVPGFGGNIDSKIYQKMRKVIADKHNLVTMQCSYFGDVFMQSVDNFAVSDIDQYVLGYMTKTEQEDFKKNPADFLKLLSRHAVSIQVTANLDESQDFFNDMSFMQAIDLITTLEAIAIILKDNGLNYDVNNILGYGHSHGAYLLHLVNRLAPHLLIKIIDNSAWIEPV